MFRVACGPRDRDGWSQAPSEFWLMCPYEWWLLFDAFVGDRLKTEEDESARRHKLFDKFVKKR